MTLTPNLNDVLLAQQHSAPRRFLLAAFATVAAVAVAIFVQSVGAVLREQSRHQQVHISILISSLVLILLMLLGVSLLRRNLRREHSLIRQRSDFVAGLAHELKTPITIVRLYAETLLESPELDPDHRAHCQVVVQEADRLNHLVSQLLDVGSIERKMKRYDLQALRLAPIIQPAIDLMTQYLARRGFTLVAAIDVHVPPVWCDAEAIKSALLNLIDNAVKYSENSRLIRLELYAQAKQVVLAVEDSGIGIDPKEWNKIFAAYYRASNDRSREGCGLGLYLVRQIMAAHAGSVRLFSEVGQGSRFELVFPVCEAREGVCPSARVAIVK